MDHNTNLKERDHVIDLESGGTSSEEDASKLLGRMWSGSITSHDCTSSCNLVMNSPEKASSTKECGGGEIVGLLDTKDKRKQTKSKKASKPPRPPRGLSLDAADLKIIKEMNELAMLKRARVERIRAMKKMKAAKAASVNSNLCATIITVLFCLIIVFQGIFSRGSSQASFRGSPESAVESSRGPISVQYYKNLSESGTEGSGSLPPNFIDQVSKSGSQEEGRRIAG